MERPDLKQPPEGSVPSWVEIWVASYEDSPYSSQQLQQLLSEDEVEKANRFNFEHLRDFYIFCRGTLRRILSGYLELPGREIEVLYGSHGKPYLGNGSSLQFNASHAGRLFACAVSNCSPVGIDIEEIRPLNDMHSIAKHFFAPAEQLRLTGIAEADRTHAFFECWTRKEAVIKATGEGVSRPLDSFEVAFGPGAPAHLLRLDSDERPGWRIHSFDPAPGYIGAVASRLPWQVLLSRERPTREDATPDTTHLGSAVVPTIFY